MHKINLIASVAAIAALAATAGVADAQARRPAAAPAASAPAAAAATPTGPAIANVCVFSTEEAIGQSAVGKYVGSRLQQIQAQVQAELQGDATPLQTDVKAYQAQAATLTPDARQQREQGLAQREQALQQKAALRQKELEATQQKALGRIAGEIQPIANTTIRARNCGLVINGQAVMAANPSMDVTPEVVRQLDAKITQFPFEREHLDTAAAAAGGAQR